MKNIICAGPKAANFKHLKKCNVKGSDLVHLFKNGTKLKRPSETTPPLKDNAGSCNLAITRYHLYLETSTVKSSGFPNLMNGNRYINQFDFPTINEAFRGKEVMYNALLLGGYENIFAFLHQL